MNNYGLLASLLTLFVWGCSSDGQTGQIVDEQFDPLSQHSDEGLLALQNKDWQLVSFGLSEEPKIGLVENSSYHLQFDHSGEAFGSLDCNLFSTPYSADNKQLTFTAIAATEMACIGMGQEGYRAQESFIINALMSAVSYEVKEATLIITASDSAQLVYEHKETAP